MKLNINKTIIIPWLFLMILPPLAMLVVGYQFNDQVMDHIPFAIADYDNSKLSQTLVQMIQENETFDVKLFADSDQQIEEKIFHGEIAAAIIIPTHFEKDMTNGQSPTLLVICDNSQLSAASTAKGKISEILGTLNMGSFSAGLQSALKIAPAQTTAMLNPLGLSVRPVNPGKSSNIFSMQGSFLSMVQVAVFILALEITRRKNMRKPWIAIRNSLACGFCGAISATIVTIIQVKLFYFPFHGSSFAWFLLTFLYLTGIAALGTLIRYWKKDKEAAIEMAPILMIMMLLSGYSYPIFTMPKLIQVLEPIIPFVHYGIPLRNIMLMGYGFRDVLPHIHWVIGFIASLWFIFLMLGILPHRKKESPLLMETPSENIISQEAANVPATDKAMA